MKNSKFYFIGICFILIFGIISSGCDNDNDKESENVNINNI